MRIVDAKRRPGSSSWFGAILCMAPIAAQAPDGAAITRELAAIAAATKVPALGGAIVTRDGLEGAWVTGVRANGSDAAVEVGDRWHLGSCTKAMTATLIALLVERGDLTWERPAAKLLPDDAAIDAGYAEITLTDLLAHRAGVLGNSGPDPVLQRCRNLAGSVVEQRAEFTRLVFGAAPATKPRTGFAYSNGGYIVAGNLAERATGKSWEDLMRELLFAPLEMTSAGFGAPGTQGADAAIDQPRAHLADGTAVPPGPGADNPPLLGPAGTVHASLADWAKFVQLHLRGAAGDVKVGEITLPRAAFARLHTPWTPPGDAKPNESQAKEPSYAAGWGVARRDWAAGDHTVITHNGSNTMWFCVCWLDPAGGFAVLATTNIAHDQAGAATDRVAALLIRDWIARHPSPVKGESGHGK
jgi:CubicO group peptidase (beta-lactamase class C family)